MKKLQLIFSITIASISFSQVPNYVPTNGLVGWWPFNGNAIDESINTNDGTVNGATLTSDRFGNANTAYAFDGLNDKIISPIINPLQANWSVSFWYKSLNSTSNFQGQNVIGLGSNMYGWGGTGFQIYGQNPPGQCPTFNYLNQMYMIDASQECGGNYLSGGLYSNSAWYNVVIIKNNLNYDLIINNVLITSSVLLDIDIDQLIFGNRDISFQYFNGNVDDVGIWNRALTQCETQDLYASQVNSTFVNAGLDQSICNGDAITLSATSSQNYSWNNSVVDGVSFTPTSTQDFTVSADSAGCLSSDFVTVTVNQSSSSIQTQAALDSYNWPINNQTYTQNGTYTDTIPNAVGCDSIITLNLTMSFTAINELNGEKLTLSPNPTTSKISVKSNLELIGSKFIIYNQLGKEVKSGIITSENTEIDLSNLIEGMYLLKVGTEMKESFKIIKQ